MKNKIIILIIGIIIIVGIYFIYSTKNNTSKNQVNENTTEQIPEPPQLPE